MSTVNRILFPTDFSRCAEGAYAHAMHFAELFGAELHVLNVVVPHRMDPGESYCPVFLIKSFGKTLLSHLGRARQADAGRPMTRLESGKIKM